VFTKRNRTKPLVSIDSSEFRVTYPRPKIGLIDIEGVSLLFLRAAGFDVTVGTLGTPYRVKKGDGCVPVIANGSLPENLTEREIVVIDLVPQQPLSEVIGEKHTAPGENDWWAKATYGVVDPRPRMAIEAAPILMRTLLHGGALVVFANSSGKQDLFLGAIRHGGLDIEKFLPVDNWSFLPELEAAFTVKADAGTEISSVSGSPIGQLLGQHCAGASFRCVLELHSRSDWTWEKLALNRFGDTVAAKLSLNKGKGSLIILPQLAQQAVFVRSLLTEALPEEAPHLFPFVQGERWVQQPPYELPAVVSLEQQIANVRSEAEERITDLQQKIAAQREELGFLHDLLRSTGPELVAAVQRTLNLLGFDRVIDVDRYISERGTSTLKREDLQIHAPSPIVLVEVKGITGLPTDEDALQAAKYIAPRMKEWGRTDVRALSILNHQRHLPALERNHGTLFRDDVVENARRLDLGLMTTWDLYRLARSFLRNSWDHDYVRPRFLESGRVQCIPAHYQDIGVLEEIWDKAGAIGVRVGKMAIQQDETLALDLDNEFVEFKAQSLQIDSRPVTIAPPNSLVGIKTPDGLGRLRNGLRVFSLVVNRSVGS
jgi:hypothetical protein